MLNAKLMQAAGTGLHDASLLDRAGCAKEKVGNELKTAGKQALLLGGTFGAGALVLKSQPVADTFGRNVDKVANALNKGTNGAIQKYFNKAAHWLQANPNGAKALAVIGTVAAMINTGMIIKSAHKDGEIQGKYQAITDIKNASKP